MCVQGLAGEREERLAQRLVLRRVGVHELGDLIAEAQLITNWEALPAEVAQLIHPHPTMSAAVGEAHMVLAGKPLHAHS